MKKLITVFIGVSLIFSLCLTSQAQLMGYDPYPAMGRIDPKAAALVKTLAREVEYPTRACLLQSKEEVYEDIWESFVVIKSHGLRISVYYQSSSYYQNSGVLFNQDWDSSLILYVRPEGSEGPDSLKIFRDDYLNGSWDRAWMNGQELDGEYLDGGYQDRSNKYDDIQNEFIRYLKFALEYFGK